MVRPQCRIAAFGETSHSRLAARLPPASSRPRDAGQGLTGREGDPDFGVVVIHRANMKKGLEPVLDSPYIRDPGANRSGLAGISEPLPEVPRTRF